MTTNVSESSQLLNQAEDHYALPFKCNNGNNSNTTLVSRATKWIKHPTIDTKAIHFGIRMAVCLTVSSLFVLVQLPTDQDKFPEGMWVLITVLFVCWFPQLDAASVLEKSVQRVIGTLIGASFALGCGLLSNSVKDAYGYRAQAVCLACCIALVSFVVCSYAVHTKVIETKNYGVILCLLTFVICLGPFYSTAGEGEEWKKSMYRVMNVIIGCVLGVGLSMSIFPRQTVCIIQEKIAKQIVLAGEASRAVLFSAAEIFSETAYVPCTSGQRYSYYQRLPSGRRPWRAKDSELSQDEILAKHEAAMKEYRTVKAQLGKLKYDPFNVGRPNDLLQSFRSEVEHTLSRAMRIQTTVVLIDGIIRNDPKHKFSEEHLELLARIGDEIASMLSVPLNINSSDAAAEQLSADLIKLRSMIVDLSAVVSKSRDIQMHHSNSTGSETSVGNHSVNSGSLSASAVVDDKGGMHAPKHVAGSHVCSLLFLQLTEHLALRSLRLYHSYKQCEGVCKSAEVLRKSVYE